MGAAILDLRWLPWLYAYTGSANKVIDSYYRNNIELDSNYRRQKA